MKILKGTHRALALPQLISPLDGVNVAVRFTPSCRYETNEPENQADWNKLTGFTIGPFPSFKRGIKSPVHWNSARFAWRFNDYLDCIEVCPYIYQDGVVHYYGKDMYLPMVELEINKWYRFFIQMDVRGVVRFFVFDKKECILDYWIQYHAGDLSWICWPYFGGNETSPHTIDIDFEYVK